MELRRHVSARTLLVLATALQLLAAVFGVLGLSNQSRAEAAQTVPYLINFQGRLTDNSGNVLSDGSYNIKFRFWTLSSGGSNVWEGDRVRGASDYRVQVANGLFNIQFGDTTKGDPALSPTIFSNGTYPLYLEVELPTPATASCATNGCAVFTEGAMTPRQPLASSPYAFNSDTLDGLDSASFAQVASANTFAGANLFAPTAASTVALTVKATTAGSTNGLEVFDSGGTRQAYFSASGSLNVGQVIQPTTNNAVDLGLAGTAFKSLFAATIDTGSVTTALTVGASNAASIQIGKTGLAISIPGGLSTGGGNIAAGAGTISGATINATTAYQANGTPGAGLTCGAGSAPTGSVWSMGLLTTTGTCSSVSSAATLQTAYTSSTGGTTAEIVADTSRKGLDIQDQNTSTIGATESLLAVRASASAATLGASLLNVNASGKVGINLGSTSTTPTISNDLSFGAMAGATTARTIGVEAQPSSGIGGNGLTLAAGAGNTAGVGGALALQGGAGGNAGAGGAVNIQGGSGTSSGAVNINASVNGATNINTGSSTGDVTIGSGTGTAGTVSIQGGAASSVSVTNATGTIKLSFAAPSTAGTVTFQLPAGGTASNTYPICTTLSVCTGYAPATAGTGYIQNTASVQTNANFYIRSVATNSVAGVVEGANGQSADLLDLNSYNGTISSTVAKFTSAGALQVTSSIDAVSGTLGIGTGNATTTTLGRSGQQINIDSAIKATDSFAFTSGSTSSTAYRLSIQGTVNSASASQYGFQNQAVFTPQAGSASVYGNVSTATLDTSSQTITTLQGFNISVADTANYSGTLTGAIALAVTAPTFSGSKTTDYRSISIGAVSSNGGNSSGTYTNSQLWITGSTAAPSSTVTGGRVDNYGIRLGVPSAGTGIAGSTVNNRGLYVTGNGGTAAGGTVNNFAIFSDSTAASQLAGALTVNGLLTGGAGLTVSGAAASLNASSNFATSINTGNSNGTVSIGNTTAGGAVTIQSASTIDVTGVVAVQPRSGNDGTAFQIQNGAGTINLFSADTSTTSASGGIINIGSAATDTNQTLLQLDSFSTFADTSTCTTSTNQGALYYNTTSNAIRGCINNAWEDVVSTAGLGIIAFGVVPDSGNNPGDGPGLVSAGVSGACKVSWASATAYSVAPCTAYSGGRKVVVTQQTSVAVSGMTATSIWAHICLTAASGQPVLSATATTENATANQPTWSANNPVVCLADILGTGTGQNISKIYDTRPFTNSQKDFVTIAGTVPGLGQLVIPSGASVTQAGNGGSLTTVVGVLVALSSAGASATTPSGIIVTNGPAYVKATTTTTGQFLISTTTAGYASSAATYSGTTSYGDVRTSATNTCAAAATCLDSAYVNFKSH